MMIQINAVQTLLVPLRLTCEVFCSLRSPKSPKLFSGCKVQYQSSQRFTFCNSALGQFEQSGRESPLSWKFRGFNQGTVQLKSSTESNKCGIKVSGGDKDLEKVVHVDKPLLWQYQNLESACYCKSSLIDVFFGCLGVPTARCI